MAGLTLKRVNADLVSPRLHVIFVHGLGDDAVSAWCREGGEDEEYFWPRWLAQDIDGLAVYSLSYPSAKLSWKSGWPIAQAAVAALDRLLADPSIRASSESPIVFICHSLGGLIVKKLLLIADRDRGQESSKGKLLDRIAGVVFLATPHGGSILASIASHFHWFVSDSMRDLQANNENLLDLSASYRNFVADGRDRIRHRVFYEILTTKLATVVAPMSADPGLPGARPVPVQRNHATICKPLDRDDEVYVSVLAFLRYDALAPRPQTQNEKLDEIIKKLSGDKGVPLDTLRAILTSMGETSSAALDAEEIEQKLVVKASEFRDLTDRLSRLTNADPVVSRMRAEASSALKSGLFDQVDQLLAHAEARDLSDLEDIEALVRQKRVSGAETRAERAAAALLRGNADAYRQAAAHYAEAARIVGIADLPKAREYLRAQTSALVSLGNEFGDNDALHEAIELLRASSSVFNRTEHPLDWAHTNRDLGVALATLGVREKEAERFEQAVEAFHASLEVWTRGRDALNWAGAQNNLGNVLRMLAEREAETEKFEQAIQAYRAALEVWTRDRYPLEWAMVQNNLGLTLERLGARDRSATRLEGAVQAYNLSLQVRTRERLPLGWAGTKYNLGNALLALGERSSDTKWLEEAIDAYRGALEERTRGRLPLDWARTQMALGNAQSSLGQRTGEIAAFDSAIVAYREGLKEITRERAPLEWATVQMNLGISLAIRSASDHDTGGLLEAIAAFRAALEEWTQHRLPLDWATAQSNLGNALLSLGNREGNTTRIDEAVVAFRAALEERTRERVPLDWATTQNNLGNAFAMAGELDSGTDRLEEAVAAYGEALKERTRERIPLGWAASFGNQGVARMLIADRTSSAVLAETAAQQIEAAFEVARSSGHEPMTKEFQAQLPKAYAIRDRLKGK